MAMMVGVLTQDTPTFQIWDGSERETDDSLALHYLSIAERAAAERQSPNSAVTLAVLEAEQDNLIAALRWFVEKQDATQAQRLACALLWNDRVRITEGRHWLERVLALPGPATKARVAALYRAGELAWRQDDMALSQSLNEEILAIAQQLNDNRRMISALGGLTRVALRRNDNASAIAYAEQAVEIAEAVGEKRVMVSPLFMLAYAMRNAGDHERATALLQSSLELNEEFGLHRMIALVNYHRGHIALRARQFDAAAGFFAASLRQAQAIGHQDVMSNNLMGCAAVAAAQRNWEHAAQLFAAGQAQFGRLAVIPDLADRSVFENGLAAVRAALNEAVFADAQAAGHAMTFEQAVEFALRRSQRIHEEN